MTALASPPRIQRRTAGQRRQLPRTLAVAAELDSAAAIATEEEARALASARLRALARRLPASPWYARMWRAASIAPGDVATVDDLAWLPPLERRSLKEHGAEMALVDPDSPDHAESVFVRSSGSTGEPVDVLKDAYDSVHMWAVLRHWMSRLRIALPRRPRVVLLCGLPGGLAYSVRLPLLEDGALHRISTTLAGAPDRLARARPDVLFADPATLHWLLSLPGPPAPRIVLSSAQHLSRDLAARTSRRLGAPVVDYYATTETGPIAWACPGGPPASHHVLLPDVWVESVGGELLVTRLRDSILPLLRYRTGDRGRVVWRSCPCGISGPTIDGLEGRHPSLFRTPGGAAVDAWQLAWIFKQIPVDSFRLVQTGSSTFELLLPGSAPAGLPELVARALERMGFPDPRVESSSIDTFPAGPEAPGGKPCPFFARGTQ